MFSLDKACKEAPKFMKQVHHWKGHHVLRDKVYTIIYAYGWMFCPNTSQHWCSIWLDKQHIWWDIFSYVLLLFSHCLPYKREQQLPQGIITKVSTFVLRVRKIQIIHQHSFGIYWEPGWTCLETLPWKGQESNLFCSYN